MSLIRCSSNKVAQTTWTGTGQSFYSWFNQDPLSLRQQTATAVCVLWSFHGNKLAARYFSNVSTHSWANSTWSGVNSALMCFNGTLSRWSTSGARPLYRPDGDALDSAINSVLLSHHAWLHAPRPLGVNLAAFLANLASPQRLHAKDLPCSFHQRKGG